MAKKSLIAKQKRPATHATQAYNRCNLCSNPRSYMRRFGICRKCFRELAHLGEIPGVKKASW